ncbi:hypothetical protein A1Q2_00990 [Trichosporon asahii var. asahii CBS 8904]|uniref:DUF803-domain-containing protein n=1 Tax=Trichosporon asahii var. asahii (strain CBS 8904) TaxID=1220162 RepID=K1VKS4_TRIAC|nr:hypothetical protein A1Q2_00990 [Trichosporon asahii var. asahii CBS 8904]
MSASASATISASASAASSSHGEGLGLDQNNVTFKIVGVCLAVGSGLFIGTSFVIKKKGLLKSTEKAGNEAGEGHAYLKSWLWWTGMIMMIIGESRGGRRRQELRRSTRAHSKAAADPQGWIGCILCILGSVILALNAPEQSTVRTIKEFQGYFVSPGFLTWAGICIAISIFIVVWVAPRYGKKHMLPYISVCSLIGGISVSCTQGLGAAIITSISPGSRTGSSGSSSSDPRINYLNKALELFNTSMVVPVYFCYFTSATMITSFILYRGLKASAPTLITMVLGFLVTCFGITILQMSKVDPTKLQGLDRRTTILLQAARQHTEADEKGDLKAMEDPGMDALRGGFGSVGSIIRARSIQRRRSTLSSQHSHGFTNSAYTGGTHMHHLSTQGLAHLPRYQLNDAPMHDEPETISLAPQPTGSSAAARSRASTLKFDDQDTVHQYGYGGPAQPTA